MEDITISQVILNYSIRRRYRRFRDAYLFIHTFRACVCVLAYIHFPMQNMINEMTEPDCAELDEMR